MTEQERACLDCQHHRTVDVKGLLIGHDCIRYIAAPVDEDALFGTHRQLTLKRGRAYNLEDMSANYEMARRSFQPQRSSHGCAIMRAPGGDCGPDGSMFEFRPPIGPMSIESTDNMMTLAALMAAGKVEPDD